MELIFPLFRLLAVYNVIPHQPLYSELICIHRVIQSKVGQHTRNELQVQIQQVRYSLPMNLKIGLMSRSGFQLMDQHPRKLLKRQLPMQCLISFHSHCTQSQRQSISFDQDIPEREREIQLIIPPPSGRIQSEYLFL